MNPVRVALAVLLSVLVLPCELGAASSASPASATLPSVEADEQQRVQQLEAFQVAATRLKASEVEGPQPIEHYGPTQIEESGAFSVEEFLDTLPLGDDDEEQLILIDGVPAYLDPSLIALGLIEGIDVALEGSTPEHGARAKGRVINIRLKKDFVGGEIGGRTSHSFAGGGDRQNAKVSVGITRGRARLMLSLSHDRAEGLRATERSFSANQDHRARGGRDLRLPWGYPAVVAALDGALDVLSTNTEPVAAGLVPEGAVSPPRGDAFLPANPANGEGAEGQRRFDTAPYRWLSTPSTRTGGAMQFHYTITPRFGLTLSASHRNTRTEREDGPPVTLASSKSVVPAAYNPFGEDVAVGLVHLGFGPTRQWSRARRSDLGLQLHGRVAETWKWNAGVGFRRDDSNDLATDLDEAQFAAALRNKDPSLRFNPFIDERASAANAHLYPLLTKQRARDRVTRNHRLDVGANGDVFQAWGGPARLSLRGRYNERDWERRVTDSSTDEIDGESEERSSYSGTASLSVPLIGAENARPGVRRLESEVAVDLEEQSDGGREREGEFGLVWSPLSWLLLRAEVEKESEKPPTLIENRPDSLTGITLLDPRRSFAVVTDVREIVRDVIQVEPEESREFSLGVTIEVPFVQGLRLKADYDDRRRGQLFQDEFAAQEVLYNEAAFPDRVIRSEPTPEDLAAGRPGAVVAVDTTGGNAGEASSRDIDLSLDYRTEGKRWGRFRFSAHARHLLDARYEIVPGVTYVNDGGGRFNPPRWRFRGNASWTRLGWTVSLRADHTGEVTTGIVDDDLPAYTEFDLNIGYRWPAPIWGRFGRGLRIMASIDNLLDREPPLADTLNGYRGGSPVGRSIQIAVTVPLGGGGGRSGAMLN